MKKILAIILTVVLTSTLLLVGATPVAGAYNCLTMSYWRGPDRGSCGPCSGTSIGVYYRTIKGYSTLPSSNENMYDRLYNYMDTLYGYTNWPAYGSGFVEMALHYGYDNFSYDYYAPPPESDLGLVDLGFYDGVIKNAIDHGWPIALAAIAMLKGFSGVPALSTDEPQPPIDWPCPEWHWIVIKGYYDGYMGKPRVVICTDSYSSASNLYLDWNTLVSVVGSQYLRAYVIRNDQSVDGYVETFEWGDDGQTLSAWEGEVDWEVSTSGSSRAQIERNLNYVHSGAGSAQFYRYSYYITRGYYSLYRPSYISFWVKKEDTAYASFINGDGAEHIIDVKFTSLEKLQYYTGSAYKDVATLQADKWYQVVLSGIIWTGTYKGRYDIYVYDQYGYLKGYKGGADMRHGTGYAKKLWFEGSSGSGSFWIDDIYDLLPFNYIP